MIRSLAFRTVLLVVLCAVVCLPRVARAGDTPPHGADVIFLIDGSGSVSPPAFALQIEAIKACLCGPGAPLAADGSVAIGVVQFSDFARTDIPLTVLEDQAGADAFCERLDLIDQISSNTRILPGLAIVEDMFDSAQDGTIRSLVILSDTVVFDFSLAQVENACADLRTAEFPVRICAAMTDEDTSFRLGLFRNMCNTPDAATFDPSEPVGILSRLEQVSEFQPICADCVSGCVQAGGPDCDNDGVSDECEPDCDQNGVPDDCDLINDPGRDLNNNGELDDCEDDCNGNGIADFIDIGSGFSTDCNENAIPDECEGAEDCNGNGIPDFCDLDEGLLIDCNINGIPDECEQVPFGVVSRRVLAVEGDEPDIGFPTAHYSRLALGAAVHDSKLVYFGDLGDPGNPGLPYGDRGDNDHDARGDVSRHDGRIFEFELATGKYRRVLREGDIMLGGDAWLTEPPGDCGEIETFLLRLPSDKALPGYASDDGAIRGVADDGSLLVAGEVFVESALCGVVRTVSGLFRVDRAGASPLFREELDVCLLEEGRTVGSARVRATGTYSQPEVQASDTEFAWLISQTDAGACAVIRSGDASPDGGEYEVADFVGGDRPYQSVARHMGAGQSLFYAETTASTAALVLDEDGTQTLIARNGTAANLPQNPAAPLTLRYSHEEGTDIGVLRGDGPDVVFAGRALGQDGIFVWEREMNPKGTPASAVVEPIVVAGDIEGVPGLKAEPGSVRLSHPVLGGPCEACDPAAGVLVFKADWTEPDTDDGSGGMIEGGPRQGLFSYTDRDGIVPVALPRQPLPPPHEALEFSPTGGMLDELDVDISGNGLVVFGSLVSAPATEANPDPIPRHAVVLASIKPGTCDVAPPFGTLDLADITRFVQGLSAGDPAVDLAEPLGTFDLADVIAFVACFGGGCP